MGFFDTLSDLIEAATPWSQVEAEAPAKEEETTDDKKDGEEDGEKGDDKGEEAEPEEEEEEEMVDPQEKFQEECKESKQCSPAKHHFDECVERVTNAHSEADKKHPGEDCVEEFFHLAHCANQCAAPKLWAALK